MPKKKSAPGFHLIAVDLVESVLLFSPDRHYPIPDFTHNIRLENKLDASASQVLVLLEIQVKDGSEQAELGRIKANFTFEIDDLDKHLPAGAQEETALPLDLLTPLNAVALSTSRGIMFMAFRGTHLHQAILPVIDPATIPMQ